MRQSEFLAFVLAWIQDILHYRVRAEAAAMSFISLLSMVPILVLLAWTLTLVPEFSSNLERVKDYILGFMVPESTSIVYESLEYVLERSASSTSLIALPVLLLSVFSLMNNLEVAFNRIFRCPSRNVVQRILYLLVTALVGPLLLAVTFAASEIIPTLSLLGWIDNSLLVFVLPTAVELLVFACLFRFVPSRSVSFGFSLLGALLLTTCLYALRFILQKVLTGIGSYELLYGIFAAIPLFFIWVYSFWLVVFVLATFLYRLKHLQDSHQ